MAQTKILEERLTQAFAKRLGEGREMISTLRCGCQILFKRMGALYETRRYCKAHDDKKVKALTQLKSALQIEGGKDK
jgi:hypothetical protein